MPEGQYAVAVVNFGGDANEVLDFAPFERYDVDSAVVDGDLLGKSTDFPALLADVQLLLQGRSGTTAIVVFSDGVAARYGRNLGHASTLAAARQLVAAHDGDVCFYTIQSQNEPEGRQLMEALAAVTPCGEYRHADSLADADSLYELQRGLFIVETGPAVSAAPVFVDEDHDGVEDGIDQCLGTPHEAHVNEVGCWVLESYAFEKKEWELIESQFPSLDEVAEVLKMNPELRIRIDGHTDSVGTEEFNQTLSENRAGAVRDYLVSVGIDAERLETRGFGLSSPVASNDTPEGKASNRRCQMTVLK
jgi:OOP family OmpA-OmpF porin